MKRIGFMELMNYLWKWGWLLYLQMRVAALLWWLRKQAGLTRVEAAKKLGIKADLLWIYEKGRASPPMHLIAKMLRLYSADDDTILFFCCLSVPPLLEKRVSRLPETGF